MPKKFELAKKNYVRNRDIATIAALMLVILLMRLSNEVEVISRAPKIPTRLVTVENIPKTLHSRRKPPPARPAVPIPTDEETIPEDLTLEPIDPTFFIESDDDGGGGEGDRGLGAPTLTPPRPIAWVIPEFPASEKKRGVNGEVKLSLEIAPTGRVLQAVVLENTTGSALCAQAAVKAALASRYIPAKEDGKPVTYWHTQVYRFGASR